MSLFLVIAVLVPAALVVGAVFNVLWRARTSESDARIAVAGGITLGLLMLSSAVLAYRGYFLPQNATGIPPMGVQLGVVLFIFAVSLALTSSLRSLLTRQSSLIRLHVWRLEGIVFLILMFLGQVPVLWALPAGLGDILIGATSVWVAHDLDTSQGKRRAIIWNVFGMIDLIVAVGLGIMTNPGPAQVFHTTPTSELLTYFPLALVPAFLVPLAFMLHVVSLWQLLGLTWSRRPIALTTAIA